jgi:hypothetical protein
MRVAAAPVRRARAGQRRQRARASAPHGCTSKTCDPRSRTDAYIVALELAIAHAFFDRPLRTFYFTFLIVGVLLTGVITALPFNTSNPLPGSLPNLEIAIRSRREVLPQSRILALYAEYPMLADADGFVTCLFGLLPAWAVAVLASRWMDRRSGRRSQWEQCILAFLRGAIIGLGLFLRLVWLR